MTTPNDNQTTENPPLDAANCSPSLIYLQWHGDGEPDDFDVVSANDVTWHSKQVFRYDVRYVRWDLVERLLSDVMAQHTDPDHPWYNDCDKPGERCQWCEWAAELFPPNAAAHPPADNKTPTTQNNE